VGLVLAEIRFRSNVFSSKWSRSVFVNRSSRSPLGSHHSTQVALLSWHFDYVVVLPDPFRGMRAQSGHAPRSGPEVKMEEVVSKTARRKGSDAGQSRRRWVRSCRLCRGVRKRCM